MDHKWGRNILKYGLGDSGCTLCARLLGDVATFVITNEKVLGNYRRVWLIPPDTAIYPLLFPFTLNSGVPHFPYGFNVEADGPA